MGVYSPALLTGSFWYRGVTYNTPYKNAFGGVGVHGALAWGLIAILPDGGGGGFFDFRFFS